jgi:hypothetical protein
MPGPDHATYQISTKIDQRTGLGSYDDDMAHEVIPLQDALQISC